MIYDKEALEARRDEMVADKYLQYKELKLSAVDRTIKLIGKKVDVPEYGKGHIVSIEMFKEHWASERYLIKITDNTAKPILKSLFPDNIMAFWQKEFTIIN